jgi:hypothetical protein
MESSHAEHLPTRYREVVLTSWNRKVVLTPRGGIDLMEPRDGTDGFPLKFLRFEAKLFRASKPNTLEARNSRYNATDSITPIQWSALSSPRANCEITSKT